MRPLGYGLAKWTGKLAKGRTVSGESICVVRLTDVTTRYCNMDYIFACALASYGDITDCLVSYDIACQWFVNLHQRARDSWPLHLRDLSSIRLTPAIPAFHYPAHAAKNHDEFDPRLVVGNGTSDNEGPERVWAAHNPLGPSTQKMGPSTRALVLDDSIQSYNWGKYAGHGTLGFPFSLLWHTNIPLS